MKIKDTNPSQTESEQSMTCSNQGIAMRRKRRLQAH
jgi:hypothetical protein